MEVSSISARELGELKDKGGNVEIIDVRTPAEYRELCMSGARNIPLDTLDPGSVMQGRQPDQPLYITCKGGTRGAKACEKFISSGYTNVRNLQGGIQAWIDAGLPVLRGKKTISLERQVRIAAGSLVLLGVIGGWMLHPGFFGLSAFVGAGLAFAGVTDTCGMAMMLSRMPWNR